VFFFFISLFILKEKRIKFNLSILDGTLESEYNLQ